MAAGLDLGLAHRLFKSRVSRPIWRFRFAISRSLGYREATSIAV